MGASHKPDDTDDTLVMRLILDDPMSVPLQRMPHWYIAVPFQHVSQTPTYVLAIHRTSGTKIFPTDGVQALLRSFADVPESRCLA
jgi:hypothetical protein